MYIIGASNIARASKYSPQLNKRVQYRITGIPSLSLNHNSPKNLNLQFYLERKPLKRTDIVIWHDILSNSLTPHHSNNKPLTIDELIQALITIKHRVKGVGESRSKERDRKSELVLSSTYQIFEWDRNNSDRSFYNVVRYVHIPLVNAGAKRSDVSYGHASMLLLGEGSEATEPYNKY